MSIDSLADSYSSVTFRVLSARTTELAKMLFSQVPEGKTGNVNLSVQLDQLTTPEEYALILQDAKNTCEPYLSGGFDKSNEQLMALVGQYLDPEGLAKRHIATFIKSLALVISYRDELSKVIRRYSREDEFGQVDVKSLFKKLTEFAVGNLGDVGEIPIIDCAVFFYVTVTLLDDVNDVEANESIALNGIDYEKECSLLLEQAGYRVVDTPKTGDFGADLIAEKNGLRFIIQCKNHNNPIGVEAIQQAYSAKEFYSGDFAVVVSPSQFTSAALKLANKLNLMCLQTGQLTQIATMCSRYMD